MGRDDRGSAPREVDVLIVGAGVCGAFMAARLHGAFPGMRIAVAERAAVVGGRLQSVLPGDRATGLAFEAGGMRVMPAEDPYTVALIARLGLACRPFPYVLPSDAAFLRGARTTVAGLPDEAGRAMYRLAPGELDESAAALVRGAMLRALARAGAPRGATRAEYRRTAFADRRLVASTFRQMLLDDGLTSEAVAYYRDAGGYSFPLGDVCAATGILEDGSLSNPAEGQCVVVGGYRRLVTDTLGPLVYSGAVRLITSVELMGIAMSPPGDGSPGAPVSRVHARFRVAGSAGASDGGDGGGATLTVRASRVVLTIPPADLRAIATPEWPDEVNDVLRTRLQDWPAAKVFAAFARPWWSDVGATSPASIRPMPRGEQEARGWIGGDLGRSAAAGRSVTDLPARQVWHWSDDPPVLMIYADDQESAFWRGLMPSPSSGDPWAGRGAAAADAGDPFGTSDDPAYPRWWPADRVPELARWFTEQVSAVFGVVDVGGGSGDGNAAPDRDALRPVSLMWRYWSHGATWWRAGWDPESLARWTDAPSFWPGDAVVLAGDAWTQKQGWVDGAIESGDRALTKHWGIPPFLPPP